MRSALVIGGDSGIGSRLAAHLLASGVDTTTTSRRAGGHGVPLDLAQDPSHWPDLPVTDVAYLCAAVAKLDVCEEQKQESARVNVTHMQALAGRIAHSGAHLVFLSTSQVFDGTRAFPLAADPVHPLTEYGRQKAAMESWLKRHTPSAAIIRLTKVILESLPMLEGWKRSLQEGQAVDAFGDLVFAPLPVARALDALVKLGDGRLQGIFHCSGAKDVSWFEVAQKLAETLGVEPAMVRMSRASDKGIRPQFLPAHTALGELGEFGAAPDVWSALGLA